MMGRKSREPEFRWDDETLARFDSRFEYLPSVTVDVAVAFASEHRERGQSPSRWEIQGWTGPGEFGTLHVQRQLPTDLLLTLVPEHTDRTRGSGSKPCLGELRAVSAYSAEEGDDEVLVELEVTVPELESLVNALARHGSRMFFPQITFRLERGDPDPDGRPLRSWRIVDWTIKSWLVGIGFRDMHGRPIHPPKPADR